MTEIYEFLDYLLPPTMNDIFQKQGNYYSLRNLKSLGYKRKFTNTYGIDTITSKNVKFGKIYLKTLKILTH